MQWNSFKTLKSISQFLTFHELLFDLLLENLRLLRADVGTLKSLQYNSRATWCLHHLSCDALQDCSGWMTCQQRLFGHARVARVHHRGDLHSFYNLLIIRAGCDHGGLDVLFHRRHLRCARLHLTHNHWLIIADALHQHLLPIQVHHLNFSLRQLLREIPVALLHDDLLLLWLWRGLLNLELNLLCLLHLRTRHRFDLLHLCWTSWRLQNQFLPANRHYLLLLRRGATRTLQNILLMLPTCILDDDSLFASLLLLLLLRWSHNNFLDTPWATLNHDFLTRLDIASLQQLLEIRWRDYVALDLLGYHLTGARDYLLYWHGWGCWRILFWNEKKNLENLKIIWKWSQITFGSAIFITLLAEMMVFGCTARISTFCGGCWTGLEIGLLLTWVRIACCCTTFPPTTEIQWKLTQNSDQNYKNLPEEFAGKIKYFPSAVCTSFWLAWRPRTLIFPSGPRITWIFCGWSGCFGAIVVVSFMIRVVPSGFRTRTFLITVLNCCWPARWKIVKNLDEVSLVNLFYLASFPQLVFCCLPHAALSAAVPSSPWHRCSRFSGWRRDSSSSREDQIVAVVAIYRWMFESLEWYSRDLAWIEKKVRKVRNKMHKKSLNQLTFQHIV